METGQTMYRVKTNSEFVGNGTEKKEIITSLCSLVSCYLGDSDATMVCFLSWETQGLVKAVFWQALRLDKGRL